jgi:protein subunit release factor A
MNEQFQSIENTYLELKALMMEESTFSDQAKVREVNKKMSDLEDAYRIAVEYRQAFGELQEANEILSAESDPDFLSLAKEQLFNAQEKIASLEEAFKVAMLPKDPNDDKNIFLEIRPASWMRRSWVIRIRITQVLSTLCTETMTKDRDHGRTTHRYWRSKKRYPQDVRRESI